MKDKVKAIRILTILTIVIMFVCIITLSLQLVKISNLKTKTNELNTRKEQLIEEIYNYNTTNSYYDNNREEYLESYAREMLSWSEVDETWYTSDN